MPKTARTFKDCPSGKLTRTLAAYKLGITPGRISTLEKEGKLKATRIDGNWYLDESEVMAYEKSRLFSRRRKSSRDTRKNQIHSQRGLLTAKAFTLFELGADLRRCVRELRIPTDHIVALYKEWQQPDLSKAAQPVVKKPQALSNDLASIQQNISKSLALDDDDDIDRILSRTPSYGPKGRGRPS